MKLFNLSFLLFFIFISNLLFAQNYVNKNRLRSKFVLEKNKKEYYKKIESNIYQTFKKEINSSTTKEWRKALLEAESLFLKDKKIFNGINKALSIKTDKYIKLQRAALESAYATDINIFSTQISKIFKITKDKVSYAISGNYLLRTNKKSITKYFLINDLKNRFRNWEKSLILKSFHYSLKYSPEEQFLQQPSLKKLFNHTFQKGKTIIFSIHRKNRNFPGITIIKKPDGSFVKNNDGSIFSIPQLAISFSNLPGYIPNGNTPTGIYSIVGTYISPTESIGPTPNILVRTPFEVSPDIFFHKMNKHKSWNKEDYKSLLPKSWQNFFPIYQSYFAGKSGRKLIIMHGSTDDLSYYKNLPYYPLSPTQGCLSTKEIWDSKTGKCIVSDQVKLVNAFRATKQNQGFLIVIEIDNKEKPVRFSDIKKYLN